MRAHRLRPSFDSLDIRLVLDSGVSTMSGGVLASTVLGSGAPAATPASQDIVTIGNWYLDGTPPPPPYNPYQAPPSYVLMPTE